MKSSSSTCNCGTIQSLNICEDKVPVTVFSRDNDKHDPCPVSLANPFHYREALLCLITPRNAICYSVRKKLENLFFQKKCRNCVIFFENFRFLYTLISPLWLPILIFIVSIIKYFIIYRIERRKWKSDDHNTFHNSGMVLSVMSTICNVKHLFLREYTPLININCKCNFIAFLLFTIHYKVN